MEQATKLQKQQVDGFQELCEQCLRHMETIKGQEQRQLYYRTIMPLIMQQYALCL
jgi:hypothetical protein